MHPFKQILMASPPSSNEDRPRSRAIHLKRSGTAVARSSDFTRGSAILHSTDVFVGVDGVHDKGGSTYETTAGVEFVSAVSKLDSIFHKSVSNQTPSTAFPPPPPPPPKSKGVRFSSDSTAADKSHTELTPSSNLETKDFRSEDETSRINTTKNTTESYPRGPSIRAISQAPQKPPPIEGMFAKAPTRHLKFIKTNLADLPESIRGHEPQIRGGIAIYKVVQPSDREKYGAMVEVHAVDYIEELKETIRCLERTTSILRGKLEHRKRGRQSQHPNGSRPALRMGTILGRRQQESERSAEPVKVSSKGKATVNFGFSMISQQISQADPVASDNTRSPVRNKKKFNYGDRKRSSEKSGSSTENGSKPVSNMSATDKLAPQRTVSRSPQTSSMSLLTSTQKISDQQDQNPKEGTERDQHARRRPKRSKTGSKKPAVHKFGKQRKSSTAEGDEHPTRQLSEPLRSHLRGEQFSTSTQDQIRKMQAKRTHDRDRISAPMPHISRTAQKPAMLSRTHSFLGTVGKGSKTATVSGQSDKASRTLSLHRESDATAPESKKPKSKSRKNGVRRLFGMP